MTKEPSMIRLMRKREMEAGEGMGDRLRLVRKVRLLRRVRLPRSAAKKKRPRAGGGGGGKMQGRLSPENARVPKYPLPTVGETQKAPESPLGSTWCPGGSMVELEFGHIVQGFTKPPACLPATHRLGEADGAPEHRHVRQAPPPPPPEPAPAWMSRSPSLVEFRSRCTSRTVESKGGIGG